MTRPGPTVDPDFSLLFVNDDGRDMRFCMRPCRERTILRPLIEGGGGQISRKCYDDSIRLLVSGDACFSDDCYDSKFIKDSVENNRLMDLKDYLIENESDKEKSTSHIIQKGKQLRSAYTDEEDHAILMSVAEKPTYVSGNSIWRAMESAKITSHSWQSMKARFQKQLKDRLPEFIDIIRKRNLEQSNDSSFEQCEDVLCEDEGDENGDVNDDEDDSMVTAVEEQQTPSSGKKRRLNFDDVEDGDKSEANNQQNEKVVEDDDMEDGDETCIEPTEYDTADEQRASDIENEPAEVDIDNRLEGGGSVTGTAEEDVENGMGGDVSDSETVDSETDEDESEEDGFGGSDSGKGTAEEETTKHDTGTEEEDEEQIYKYKKLFIKKYGLTTEEIECVFHRNGNDTNKVIRWFKKIEQRSSKHK